MSSLVSVTRTCTRITASPAELAGAKQQLEREHALLIPSLLGGDLLSFLQHRIEIDGFHQRVHEDLPSRPVDLALNHGIAASLLALVTNDPTFLELARTLTGRSEIRSFLGRVHRRVPNAGHEDAWHDDLTDGRIAALTINLSAAKYEGGVMQIRDASTHRIVYDVSNNGPGDAVLFELHDNLEHRVTTPTGAVPRTVYAGSFRTQRVREYFGLPESSQAGMR